MIIKFDLGLWFSRQITGNAQGSGEPKSGHLDLMFFMLMLL